MLEGVDLKALGHNSPAYVHTITEALNLAFADREAYVGDPRFVEVPVAGLLSDDYAAKQRARIRARQGVRTTCPRPGSPPARRASRSRDASARRQHEPARAPDTIYCCVVDDEGNCYSATLSDNARDTP